MDEYHIVSRKAQVKNRDRTTADKSLRTMLSEVCAAIRCKTTSFRVISAIINADSTNDKMGIIYDTVTSELRIGWYHEDKEK